MSIRPAGSCRIVAVLVHGLLCLPRAAAAKSVQAHEAIDDAAWADRFAPLLTARYGVSGDALKKARAFAYGGCLIQDIGYYPFSSRTFGNLTHYVRSGDFVEALLAEAANADELAFGLGALAHYAADTEGHPAAVNLAVPMLYPKLGVKFGPSVTYVQNPAAHVKTEFGFDVLQVARGRYASDAFHDFIGFEISRPVLERAFRRTYGLELKDVFGNLDFAIGTFRRTVSTLLPNVTRIAWELKRDEIQKADPTATPATFQYAITRAEYETQWGSDYARPGFWQRFFAALLRIVPKIGPFKALSYKPPTPEAERLFLESFAATTERYGALVDEAGRGRLSIANRNFDTGQPVRAGVYPLVDETYATLVERLAKTRFAGVSPALRADILAFVAPLRTSLATRKAHKRWRTALAALDAWPPPDAGR